MLKIEIEVPFEVMQGGGASDYLSNALAAMGYTRVVGPHAAVPAPAETAIARVGNGSGAAGNPTLDTLEEAGNDGLPKAVEEPKAEEKPKGKPGRPKKVVETPKTEDPPEVQAQDAVDEKIEADANRATPDATLDDVRQAMMSYVEKFGMPAASEDGPKIFEKALGEAHLVDGKPYVDAKGAACVDATGKPYWTMGQLKTPEQFGKAQAYWAAAASENPFDREPVKKG